jgi:hypothetical protein
MLSFQLKYLNTENERDFSFYRFFWQWRITGPGALTSRKRQVPCIKRTPSHLKN